MRWIRKSKPIAPVEGANRTITKFLWLPKTIGNETRWLEKASIYQVYAFIPLSFRYTTQAHYGGEWVGNGFVERVHAAEDRRKIIVRITQK